MLILPLEITIRELSEGYSDNAEAGVVGYGGKLDIRPPYQREFIYKDKQRDAVIDTIRKGFPLNVMYWAVREDGTFEVIDGQQRTISICQYVDRVFSINGQYIQNLTGDQREQIFNYKLTIYTCSGTDSEKLDWFRIINIPGVQLTDQELLNAVFAGSWTTDAKRYFSKTGCPAFQIGQRYLTGSPIRQEYLETAIDWISNGEIKGYMAIHQHDQNASALWRYFQDVVTWVSTTFPVYRKEMKGVKWGLLYNEFKDKNFDTNQLESQIQTLINDDEVESVKGIYPYILTGNTKHLHLRQFDIRVKRKVYERQKGICPACGNHFEFSAMEADHIDPWHLGGKTIEANCQMLCLPDNRTKGGR